MYDILHLYMNNTWKRQYAQTTKRWFSWYVEIIIWNILHIWSFFLHFAVKISRSQDTFLAFYPIHLVKSDRMENSIPKKKVSNTCNQIALSNDLRLTCLTPFSVARAGILDRKALHGVRCWGRGDLWTFASVDWSCLCF